MPSRPPDPHAPRLADAQRALAAGRLDAAAGALDAILARAPDHPEALMQRAVVEVAAERPAAAAGLLERLCAVLPGAAEPRVRLGQLRLLLGEDERALAAFEAAAALAPGDVRVFEGLAEAHKRLNRDFAALVRARLHLVELQPREVEHRLRLGYTLRGGDMAEAAEAAYRDALALRPDHPVARWSLFQHPPTAIFDDPEAQVRFARQWSEGLAWFESLDPRRCDAGELERALLTATDFALHYLPGPLREERSRHADAIARLAHAIIPPPAPRARPAGSRRRVAVVSAFFRRHSVTKVLGAMLEGLDRERFEVGVFHLDPRRDAWTERFAAGVAHYAQGVQRPRAWLDAIAAFAPDVVVFLDVGMEALGQVLASYRLAPRQLVLWGHPLTSGHASIDEFVVGDAMEVPDPSTHYRERVRRLPGLGCCYRAPGPVPAGASEPLEPGCVHFLLAQMVLKITPPHDDLLARIARRLPQARFHVLASPRAHVREALAARMKRAFDARGVDFERHVRLLPPRDEAGFFALAATMDVNLDTLGWSGGVSTLDLLAFDLPTLTVETPTLRGRQSAAMLLRAGVPELVCADADAWVDAAVALGRDADHRRHLRERLAAGKGQLYDDTAPVEAFARLLLEPG
jgi:predicted O-linked N-acetylglucosamine transferase (SPINDLY family)